MSSIPPHEAGASRRRTVLASVARRPFALIAQHPQVLRSIILDFAPCVAFPSITHFRDASDERWAGVVIARASAWDPALDIVAKRRTPIALIDVILEHEWPAEIARLDGEAALRGWLERCLEPKQAKQPERPAPRRSTSLPPQPTPDLTPETPPSAVALSDMRVYGRPRSELLIVAKTPSLRVALFRALRVGRPVRVVSDLSELSEQERAPEHWLGIVIGDGDAPEELTDQLARHPCVVLRVEAEQELDELALKRWLLRAVAYEYAGNSAVAEIISEAFMRADPASYVASIEVCALYAVSLRPDQRAAALDMTDHTWRWYAKESAKALTISSKALARKALDTLGKDELLPPSPWLPRETSEAPARFQTLLRRLPRELHDVPLSRVPWPDNRVVAIARIALEHDLHTVSELLSLALSELDPSWGHERTCDSLQEALLATLPFAGGALAHEAAHFGPWLQALQNAMPNEAEASSLLQPPAQGRSVRGAARGLRFHETSVEAFRNRLMRALDAPATLSELRERDPFFSDLSSLEQLRDVAHGVLRLPLYLSEGSTASTRIWTKQSKQPRSEAPRAVSAPAPAPLPRLPSAEEGLTMAEQALREAGTPLDRGALAQKLGEMAQTVFYRMSGARPFVELDVRTWGLIDRDVPGGNAAFDQAVSELRATWGSQLNTSEAVIETVRTLSDEHAQWTREMIVAAIRYARSLRG